MLDKNISGVCGEYYVLSQLLRKGYEAYLAQGSTHKGWDIIVFFNKTIKKVQVKTLQWEDSKVVQGNFKDKDFDFLVIVTLNRSFENKVIAYDSLIIPRANVTEKKKSGAKLFINENIQFSKIVKGNPQQTITLTTLYSEENSKIYTKYKNKWSKIGV